MLNLGRVESFLKTRAYRRSKTSSDPHMACQAAAVPGISSPWGSPAGEASCTQAIPHIAPSRGVTQLEAVSLWHPAKACEWVLASSTSVPRHPAVSKSLSED